MITVLHSGHFSGQWKFTGQACRPATYGCGITGRRSREMNQHDGFVSFRGERSRDLPAKELRGK